MQLRVIHTADWHLNGNEKKQAKARKSLDKIVEYVKENKTNLLIVAGDIWDSPQIHGNGSGVGIAYTYLYRLSSLVDFIFIIKGNNAHDTNDSVSFLNGIRDNIIAVEKNVVLGLRFADRFVEDLIKEGFTTLNKNSYDIILHGLPYPTKANILSSNDIDSQNNNFIELYSQLLSYHKQIADQYNAPALSVFHGNMTGAKLSNGQTLIGQDILIPVGVLESTGAIYNACGHIHLWQKLSDKTYYSGSLYNKDFGELEQKYFNEIIIRNDKVAEINAIELPRTPMQVIRAKFEDGDLKYSEPVLQGAEIKVKLEIAEEERALIDESLLSRIEALSDDVKVEIKVKPKFRQRSEGIIEARSVHEEVEEYARLLETEYTDTLKDKITKLINEG